MTETETVRTHAIHERNSILRKISISLTSLIVLVLFALARSVTADQVKLDIQGIVNDEHQTEAIITIEEGEGSRIQLDGNYRISITPSITNLGDIQLDLVLMKLEGEEYRQVASPIIRTPNGETAMIKSATDDGLGLTLEITPTIQ